MFHCYKLYGNLIVVIIVLTSVVRQEIIISSDKVRHNIIILYQANIFEISEMYPYNVSLSCIYSVGLNAISSLISQLKGQSFDKVSFKVLDYCAFRKFLVVTFSFLIF